MESSSHELKKWYGGYIFNEKEYLNPNSVLNYFKNKKFDTYSFEKSKELLDRLFKSGSIDKQTLHETLEGRHSIEWGQLYGEYVEKKVGVQLKGILHGLGLLGVKEIKKWGETERYLLGARNKEAESIFNLFLK